jgi:uncharacterized damage-inducible protein DinB
MTVAKLIGPAMLFCILSANGQTLTPGERQRAAAELRASRKVLLDAIRGLSPAQWNFKPAPGRWSVAVCAEHIAVTEDFYYDLVANQLARYLPRRKRNPRRPGKIAWFSIQWLTAVQSA